VNDDLLSLLVIGVPVHIILVASMLPFLLFLDWLGNKISK
jgi:hypothetical protein